jgi:hypothetical protein
MAKNHKVVNNNKEKVHSNKIIVLNKIMIKLIIILIINIHQLIKNSIRNVCAKSVPAGYINVL